MIQCKNLSISFSGESVFQGLDVTLEKGIVYGLVGPNGAGKTTFLNMLCGMISPTTGGITFSDGHTEGEPIGLSLEVGGFYENKSLIDNIGLIQCLRGASEKQVNEAMVAMGISPKLAKKKIRDMSQGQKQRSRIVSAVLGWPSLVLFDEPNNGLDPEGFIQFRKLVKQLRDMNSTVVVSSHLLSEVHELCDRVLFLIKGELDEETVESGKDLEALYLEKTGISGE